MSDRRGRSRTPGSIWVGVEVGLFEFDDPIPATGANRVLLSPCVWHASLGPEDVRFGLAEYVKAVVDGIITPTYNSLNF